MLKSIQHRFFFAHPAESVWAYLTDSDMMAEWLMPNDFQLVPGHEFRLRTTAMPEMGSDGIFHCQVLEIVPFRKLSYSWKTGPGDGTMVLDTVVVWTLQEREEGTELELEHSGFREKEDAAFYQGMLNGWVKKGEKIEKLLNQVPHAATNS